jgi:histidinol-phosphate phosphatase family protein
MQRTLLLDRDGTICHRHHYLTRPDQVTLIDGVGESLRSACARGLQIFVLTNQSAVGRGLLSQNGLAQINKRLILLLEHYDVHITDIVSCPHIPEDRCDCRKPRVGLFQQLEKEHGITPMSSVMVGDAPTDEAAAQAWGCRFVAVRGELSWPIEPKGLWASSPDEAIRLAIDLLSQYG